MDFAQHYAGGPEAVHTRLVAGPMHMKQFVELLQNCLADYEKRYGRVELPAAP